MQWQRHGVVEALYLEMSAYMSTRRVKPPPPLFLLFFLPPPFSSSTAPQAFPRPDRRMLPPARAGCVKAGRFSAATVRLGLYTTEHDGRLDGFGRLLLSSVTYPSSCQRALFRSGNVLSVGLATKSMARAMFASTYIRQLRSGLPRCCLHGRSCRRDGAHLSNGRLASADLRCGHTATHPTRPTHPTGGVGTQRTVNVIA